MIKIVLIIPYFGKFSTDFKFWLKSVSTNPTVDFLLITDNVISNPPSNVKIVNKTFEETQRLIQNFFDFKINLLEPYKFCDFRPCFGEVFADFIKEYDFWGYTDTDIVYGNIRQFITEKLLLKYDRILGRGHFTLQRNNENLNTLYKKVDQPSYQQVFTFSYGCAFDEYWGYSRYWDKQLGDRFYQAFPFDDIDCTMYSFHAQMRRKEDTGKKNFIYSYENGKLYRIYEMNGKLHKDETMYVHFQKRKMKIKTNAQDKFNPIPNAYIPFVENLDIDQLRSFDVSKKWYLYAYKLQWKRVVNKWKKIKASLHPSKFGIPILPIDGINYYKEK